MLSPSPAWEPGNAYTLYICHGNAHNYVDVVYGRCCKRAHLTDAPSRRQDRGLDKTEKYLNV